MLRKLLLASAVVLLLALPMMTVSAQSEPAVYGLFFYSPTCPHCHIVMDDHWPAIDEEFGDQLVVLFVDVSTQQGSALMGATRQAMNIQSNGVPMLVLGERVFVGSVDIPQNAPAFIRNALASGGVGVPPVPGLQEVFDRALAERGETAPAGSAEGAATTASVPAAATTAERFAADPVANTVALGVLFGLAISLLIVLAGGVQFLRRSSAPILDAIAGAAGHQVLAVTAFVGVVLAATLVLGSAGNAWVMLLATVEAVLFLVIAIFILRQKPGELTDNLLLLVIAAGLGVSLYLAYVEVTLSEAVCGAVGNCNTVQQSEYARIMGIPIAVLGTLTYLVALFVVLLRRTDFKPQMDALLLLIAIVGTAFSAYLTFLEPFVIGATCVWCLTSAVVMLLLLWLVAPTGWQSVRQVVRA